VVRQEYEGRSNNTAQQESLQQAERLFHQAKFCETLEQLNRLVAQEGVPETERLKDQLLKCRI